MSQGVDRVVEAFDAANPALAIQKKKRGRPPGSKNKPKDNVVPFTQPPVSVAEPAQADQPHMTEQDAPSGQSVRIEPTEAAE
jgi:hypothetical protein